MPGRQSTRQGGGEPERDLQLSPGDVDLLLDEVSRIFSTEDRAGAFLRTVRFPGRLVPSWTDALGFWTTIFTALDSGAMEEPYRRLIVGALRVYSANQVLIDLQDRYAEDQVAPEQEAESPAEPEPACHVVLRVTSEEERGTAEAWLADLGFDPREEWVSATAVSFRLNEADSTVVTEQLRALPDIGWTVVPPGQPDYLLRQLFVEGPDGRSFRFSDVPASSTVGSVGEELIEQYPEGLPGSDQPLVIDRVAADGSGRRTNPDNTLAEEGITEDSRLRVGFQRRAAAVNPLDRREALFRVRNQLQQYVDANPEFRVWPNSPALPTEYDIEFTQPSFGPPVTPGEQPPDLDRHELSIVLGQDFPITAPRVRWLTEVFHPNVFPTYDCDLLREREYMRGLVCLGTLAESYQPALDFAELCKTLRDIAGYRNYSVFAPDDAADPVTGQPLLHGDFYDRYAAQWVLSSEGQARIAKIGGMPVRRIPTSRTVRYGFEIELDT